MSGSVEAVPQGFRLNKEIGVPLVVATLIQVFGLVTWTSWFTAKLESRVEAHDIELREKKGERDRLTRLETQVETLNRAAQDQMQILRSVERYIYHRAEQPRP